MRQKNLKRSGLVLIFCILLSRVAVAQLTAPPANPLVLHVQTADGKALRAPVVKFKALSLAVIVTLIKEGKMNASQAPENDPHGYMTFYLDKSVSADFVNWAKSSLGQSSGAKDSGEFTWPAKNGYPAETFKMRGLKVVGFVPAMGSDGVQLVLDADKTEAFPSIDFSRGKK
jgi:hypothetical protein